MSAPATTATAADKLRAALTAHPGTTPELAIAAGIGRSTATTLLAKWETEGTARRTRGPVGKAATWEAVPAPGTSAAETAKDAAEAIGISPVPTLDEMRAAAMKKLGAELTANADAIGAIMDAPLPGESDTEEGPTAQGMIETAAERLRIAIAAHDHEDTIAGLRDELNDLRNAAVVEAVQTFDASAVTAAQVPGLLDLGAHLAGLGVPAAIAEAMAANAPQPAPACHCNGDEVGHVHPARPARKAPRTPRVAGEGGKAGKLLRARNAAFKALADAGEAGVNVRALWTAMEEAGPIVWVGAYRLLNALRREGHVTVSDEHKAEDRTAYLTNAGAQAKAE